MDPEGGEASVAADENGTKGQNNPPAPLRFGRVIKLKTECEQEYREYHRNLWPEIEAAIRAAGIKNYSIFLRDGYLFAYMELAAEISPGGLAQYWANNETCKEWEKQMNRMQEPLSNAQAGESWAPMDEIFHQD